MTQIKDRFMPCGVYKREREHQDVHTVISDIWTGGAAANYAPVPSFLLHTCACV